jgi:hypothetical protein
VPASTAGIVPEAPAVLFSRAELLAGRTYGVLVGSVKAVLLDPNGNAPHYEIWIDGGEN